MTDYRFNSMKELVESSIEAYDGIIACFPLTEENGRPKEEGLTVGDIAPKYEHAYNIRNVICAYIYEGKLYVIPWTKGVENLLLANGFWRDFIYVPFSNLFSYPRDCAERWNELMDLAREVRKTEGFA